MGAGIMVSCKNETLIIKRANYKEDKYSGYWNFPGGQGEEGETHYETAIRECREEIGVSVPYIKILDHSSIGHYTLFFGYVPEKFTPKLDHEHTDHKWIPLAELDQYDLHPKDMKCLRKASSPNLKVKS
jgi:mutator protein MutT